MLNSPYIAWHNGEWGYHVLYSKVILNSTVQLGLKFFVILKSHFKKQKQNKTKQNKTWTNIVMLLIPWKTIRFDLINSLISHQRSPCHFHRDRELVPFNECGFLEARFYIDTVILMAHSIFPTVIQTGSVLLPQELYNGMGGSYR